MIKTKLFKVLVFFTGIALFGFEIQTNKEADKQTNKQTNKEAENKQTDKQTNNEADTSARQPCVCVCVDKEFHAEGVSHGLEVEDEDSLD